jgi:hypothetical protein
MGFVNGLDRAISGKFWRQVLYLFGAIIIVFLGFVGLSYLLNPKDEVFLIDKMNSNWFGVVSHFFDSGNIHVATDAGRVFAIIVAFVGSILMSGVLISVFSNVIERRVDFVREGKVSYKHRNHVVILGFNDAAIGVLKELFTGSKNSKVIIQTENDVPKKRESLYTYFSDNEIANITFYKGRRTCKEDLEKLELNYSSMVYIIGEESDWEPDSLNLDCLFKIEELFDEVTIKPLKAIPCYVMLNDSSVYNIAKNYDVGEDKYIDFIPFNFYEEWSRKVFCDFERQGPEYKNAFSLQSGLLKANDMFKEKDLSYHLIIVGFKRMGQQMFHQAIRNLHFGNERKCEITIIDKELNKLFPEFRRTVPGYKDLQGFIKVNELNADFFSDGVFEFIESELAKKVKLGIVICFGVTNRALKAALNLPDVVYSKNIPVFVRQDMSDGIEVMINDKQFLKLQGMTKKFSEIHFYGNKTESIYDSEYHRIRETIARAAHNSYIEVSTKLWGEDNTSINKRPWGLLPEYFKWSNRYLADNYIIKLQYCGLQITQSCEFNKNDFEEISCLKELGSDVFTKLAIIEHSRWVGERISMGWRFGKRNDEFKIHNNIVAWDKIDEDTRKYDYGVIESMVNHLNELGYRVIRRK